MIVRVSARPNPAIPGDRATDGQVARITASSTEGGITPVTACLRTLTIIDIPQGSIAEFPRRAVFLRPPARFAKGHAGSLRVGPNQDLAGPGRGFRLAHRGLNLLQPER